MGRKKKILPRELLEGEYWDNQLSIRQIAEKYKLAKDTINKLLANYDIPIRNATLTSTKSSRKTQKIA